MAREVQECLHTCRFPRYIPQQCCLKVHALLVVKGQEVHQAWNLRYDFAPKLVSKGAINSCPTVWLPSQRPGGVSVLPDSSVC